MRKARPRSTASARRLIELAEHEGGTDNITVLLARVHRGWGG